MKERKLVLIDPETEREPLRLEFLEDIHISCADLIVCEIPLNIAYAFLERQDGYYFEDHIYIPRDIQDYLVRLKKEKEENDRIWEQVNKVEEYFEKERKKGRK